MAAKPKSRDFAGEKDDQVDREVRRGVQPPPTTPTEYGVVGVSYRPGYPENLINIADAGGDMPVVLDRDAGNEFDPNAVAVHVPGLGDSHVGFLPRPVALRLAPALDNGERWAAKVSRVTIDPNHPDRPGLHIYIWKDPS